MYHSTRTGIAVLCVIGLISSPAFGRGGARRRALGVVAETNLGHIDTANAVTGADIYSCDKLDTDPGGALRARVGTSQIYLSSASFAELEDDGSEVQLLANSGTVGFSQTVSGQLAVRTPAGVVRGATGAAAGEITYKSLKELVITSIRGDLTLDTGGQLRTIPEGKSADVTFDDSNSQSCHDGAAADQPQQNPLNRPKIGFIIVGVAAVAIPSALLWHDLSESDSKPHK